MAEVNLAPKQPKVVQKEEKKNNLVDKKRTRIVSNILSERRVATEGDLMLKLARNAQKAQIDKEQGKVQKIERKEHMIMEQLEAKQKRRDDRQAKKKQFAKKAEKGK